MLTAVTGQQPLKSVHGVSSFTASIYSIYQYILYIALFLHLLVLISLPVNENLFVKLFSVKNIFVTMLRSRQIGEVAIMSFTPGGAVLHGPSYLLKRY